MELQDRRDRLTAYGGTARFIILLIATLTALLLLGLNVWPIITGLSVFGLAISFGSQTLVKDIVSGVFFLVDDAFRMGEYVETSGAKGTVERISVRSLRLRQGFRENGIIAASVTSSVIVPASAATPIQQQMEAPPVAMPSRA